jgi:para-nitrobenzyl esterase
MIFGQSGGGGKVNTLMAMPSAKGLFHRAGVQSGSLLRVGNTHDSYELASAVLKRLNISASDVDQLQAVSTDQLLLAATAAQQSFIPPRTPNAPPVDFRHLGRLLGWEPVVDGKVIPQQTWDPGAPQLSSDVPLLVGSVLNEFVTAMDEPDAFSMTNEELSRRVSATYGSDKSKEIIDAFRDGHPKANPFQLFSIISVSSKQRSNRPGSRPLLEQRPRTYIGSLGRPRSLMDVPWPFIARSCPFALTTRMFAKP